MSTHLAAITFSKGDRFKIQSRPTPKPGSGELLIEVKSVALNPADGHMRNQGLLISTYPTVIGFDIAGLVLEVGENVPITPVGATDEEIGPLFQPGITRVAAYAASYWRSCNPDYGAFQERCLVPWQHAVPLIDENITWNQAATLPVAVQVPLSAWDALNIPRASGTLTTPSAVSHNQSGTHSGAGRSHGQKRDALLIWGASSSVGTMGVQTARLLREDRDSTIAAVYATAGAANHEYVASLGANHVFDYKDPGVADAIIAAAREDELVIRYCFLATGQLAPCQAVLKAFLGEVESDQSREKQNAKIASAPVIPPNAEEVNGVETIFVMPSMAEEERLAQFRYWMGTWLRGNLKKENIKPSPVPRVIGKGLGAINAGLDELLRGVSCTKLVVEIAE